MTEPASRVRLVEVQRLLALFAQGLCGDPPRLEALDEGAETGRRSPEAARTDDDGATLRLPAAIADFASYRENLGAYRIAILHQLGYREFGTLDFSIAALVRRIPELAAVAPAPTRDSDSPSGVRVPGLPLAPPRSVPGADPVSELDRFYRLWPAPWLVRQVFTTIEDLRIDSAIRRRYPGARADLDRVCALALRTRPELDSPTPLAELLEALLRFSLGESQAGIAEAFADAWRGGRRAGTDERVTDLIAAAFDAARAVTAEDADVHDTAVATVAWLRMLERIGLVRRTTAGDVAALPTDDTPDAEAVGGDDSPPAENPQAEPGDDDSAGFFPVAFRGESRLEVLQGRLRSGIAGALDAQTTPVDPDAEAGDGDTPPDLLAPRLRIAPRAAREARDGATSAWLYDEWDYHQQAYLEGWCRVLEERLEGDDHGFIRRVHERHGALAARIRRQFRAIRPESRQRVRRMPDGEELELDEAIRRAIDRRAGHIDDDRVYIRRERGQREVSAVFLLDMSASTDIEVRAAAAPAPAPASPAPESDDDIPFLWNVSRSRSDYDDLDDVPERPVRRVIDVARESLALMCEAMQALGDRYAIYGFSGYGRENVEFCVAKDFDDRLSARTWAAIAAMKPRRSTRMGPAIRHALTRLVAQPTRIRVLIVVSDGFPQDRDYGPDRNDDEYGVQDTARALFEAQRAGVQTFCVTIDPSGHDYLRRMCPDDRYLVIDEVEDLPDALTKVYRALTF